MPFIVSMELSGKREEQEILKMLKRPCSSNPCQNGGNCTVEGKNFKCDCKSPFIGGNCEIGPCSSNPCQNGGTCSVDGQNFKCSCKKPFTGNMCETDPCTSSPCLNKGKCTVNGNSFKCACQGPFFGNRCENDPCSFNPCHNDGKCKITGNTYSCDCPEAYVGERCQHGCDCKNGKCRVTSDDHVLCECLPEYGKKSDDCEPCDCGTGANCTWESDIFFGNTKYCLCPDGSKLKEQHCEDPCNSNPCLNNGKCKAEGKIFKCECRPPYAGRMCKDDLCTKNPCQNGGICKINGTSFECKCEIPYTGKLCEKDLCTINPCQNGGICRLNGTSFLCYCRAPYSGKLCELNMEISTVMTSTDSSTLKTTTFPSTVYETSSLINVTESSNMTTTGLPSTAKDVCNDDTCIHGKCEVIGQYYRCRCDEGFIGFRCEDKVQTISDKPVVWQLIQTSILFSILILLSGMFCFILRRKK
ncbi:Sushi, nidogen and EGF-like domain-containing protein 1 [Araneus ventricosus]|uniref:Sushi, nidogen and EGF-like domain-containing protein 1 n=1 Tax=Araneus ventricosus TaxID=182803 RepID=A0A4Y2KN18_ARAVE|nr:Sushi, nidogen and EGF-like domain-containing protein 1 [Araneus ventricosus]